MFQFCPFCRGSAPVPWTEAAATSCACGRCVVDHGRSGLGLTAVVLVGSGGPSPPTARFSVGPDGARELVLGYGREFFVHRDSDLWGPAGFGLEDALDFLELAPVLES